MQGGARRGVQVIGDFYGRLLGTGDWESEHPVLEEGFWRQVSDASLAAAVNGEVFTDPEGIFSGVRKVSCAGYPEQIRLVKLAESAAMFSQAGQYNYERMLQRGDRVSAQILLGDCLRAAAKLIYYAQNQYPPHDKWLVKGLEKLEKGAAAKSLLEAVELAETAEKPAALEKLAGWLAQELYQKHMISDIDSYLDHHTAELLQKAQYAPLTDEELVDRITELEYTAFDKVHNVGGRAFCQDDWRTFSIMRKSQYLTFTRTMLLHCGVCILVGDVEVYQKYMVVEQDQYLLCYVCSFAGAGAEEAIDGLLGSCKALA